ncbi:hypothetical protein BT96DRAFT_942892 [Gymnopus androsaceus JB14]|uniref:ABC transporter domain-containing protein n=1 Tax=Gymnopus androsaceus JB14 TaxID=1447944 RepID=A0A6A4H980_9AGAR|nr:hypothetical protein BT96DRAFT_942892 [Gymnopus androsaceus JB14]
MANTNIASSQQTRFHVANSTTTTSSSSSKELDVPGVCISIPNAGKRPEREILSDTHLKSSAGVHYALIGHNGVGKSTLLRAIGEKLIPGLPTGLRIVLLQQTYLILLQQALNIHDPTAAVMTMRNLKLKDGLRELEEARKTANLRSGSRGLAARKELKKLEIVDSQTLAEETSEAITMLADIDALMEETYVLSVDVQVDFLPLWWLANACTFSRRPVSTLDEPTNFLNLPSLLWLETHLQQDLPPNTTVLFVSHDRTFTDAVAEEILVLRDLTLGRFPGNLSSYEATRSERQRYLVKMQDAQSRQRAHMQDTVTGSITLLEKETMR